jgi:hypothetical protein
MAKPKILIFYQSITITGTVIGLPLQVRLVVHRIDGKNGLAPKNQSVFSARWKIFSALI